jgi:hypothetical protein
LVGAIAPVTSPSFASCLRPRYPAGSVFCSYSSAQHIPRRQRSPLRGVYATSENPSGAACGPANGIATVARGTYGACAPPVLEGRTGGTQAPCVSNWTCTQIGPG